MTTFEIYIKANFDTLKNSIECAEGYKNNIDMMISQLETLARQAKSFTDWLKLKEKFE